MHGARSGEQVDRIVVLAFHALRVVDTAVVALELDPEAFELLVESAGKCLPFIDALVPEGDRVDVAHQVEIPAGLCDPEESVEHALIERGILDPREVAILLGLDDRSQDVDEDAPGWRPPGRF